MQRQQRGKLSFQASDASLWVFRNVQLLGVRANRKDGVYYEVRS